MRGLKSNMHIFTARSSVRYESQVTSNHLLKEKYVGFDTSL